nr:hypothetical protein [Tanacetum cinerariifolium]
MVLLGSVPEPEDEASQLAVEESRLAEPELGNSGLDKPVLDKLEAGFNLAYNVPMLRIMPHRDAIDPPRPFKVGWHNSSIVRRSGTGKSPPPLGDGPSSPFPDDDDEKEEESSGDDADDQEEDEDEDKEDEEEHLAPADTVPPLAYYTTTRMFFRAQTSIPLSSETEVARLLAIPTSPSSLLTSYSSPLPLITSPPLLANPTYPLGYRAAMNRLRAESPSTSHPLPLPPPIVLPHTGASIAMIRAATPSPYILAS